MSTQTTQQLPSFLVALALCMASQNFLARELRLELYQFT